ncbi:MAG: methyltransferase domain-containing protein [Alphaproteobacteria bacterium]|nr:methyltransferase domain-containing protein [Alphaproteobacteria bacterium]
MEKTYLPRLQDLKRLAADLPRTRFMALARSEALIRRNMGWEALQYDQALPEHPFVLTHALVERAIGDLEAARKIAFCDGGLPLDHDPREQTMEEEHQDLFQSLWTQFDADQYRDRITRYDDRLRFNGMEKGTFDGMRIVDMGCGHGNFDHALLNAGASEVVGVDYGSDSIRYAEAARDKLGVPVSRLRFIHATVYDVPEESGSFDAAVQNGVFHHLDDEDRAYREMHRLLKPGGIAWIYTEGEGSIARDLFHVSVQILADVPAKLVQDHLAHLGFSINKRYHLGDGLKAVYRATSWADITGRLTAIGFGDFKRLIGGFDTDLDVTDADPYAAEKFGEADIRILAKKLA